MTNLVQAAARRLTLPMPKQARMKRAKAPPPLKFLRTVIVSDLSPLALAVGLEWGSYARPLIANVYEQADGKHTVEEGFAPVGMPMAALRTQDTWLRMQMKLATPPASTETL